MLGQLLALKKDLELTKVIQTLLKPGVVWQSIFLMFVALVLVNLSFARTVIRKVFVQNDYDIDKVLYDKKILASAIIYVKTTA